MAPIWVRLRCTRKYAGVGEPGQTVNLLRMLSGFESLYFHKLHSIIWQYAIWSTKLLQQMTIRRDAGSNPVVTR